MKEQKKKERKLSKAELKRKEAFEQLTDKLVAEGYTPKMITMGALAANLFAIVVVLPIAIPLFVIYMALGNEFVLGYYDMLICAGVFFFLIIVHEFIHGLFFSFFAKDGWKAISFGFIAEYLTPYCCCNQPVKKYQMIISAVMPTVILGFGFWVAAVLCNSTILLIISIFNISGGGGDLFVILKILLYKTTAKEVLYIDHPYEIGTAVFEK